MATRPPVDRTLPPSTRGDRTAAWAALAGHFEAHGRSFDLREAFARDPRRFESLSLESPEVFADLSKNLVDAARLRSSRTWRASAASRLSATRCSPAQRSTSPSIAPSSTPRCARRAARHRSATTSTSCSTRCWGSLSRFAHRGGCSRCWRAMLTDQVPVSMHRRPGFCAGCGVRHDRQVRAEDSPGGSDWRGRGTARHPRCPRSPPWNVGSHRPRRRQVAAAAGRRGVAMNRRPALQCAVERSSSAADRTTE